MATAFRRWSVARRGAVAVALVAVTGACAPSRHVAVGVKELATNVVYGGADTPSTTAPAPVELARLDPGFPSFIAPAPPPLPPLATEPNLPPPAPTTAPVDLVAAPCDPADPSAKPIAVTPKLTGTPVEGTYTYKQAGTYQLGDAAPGQLPATVDRKTANVQKASDGTPSWDVVIEQLGTKTTTSYAVVRRIGQPELDGIYITRIVMRLPDGSSEAFSPVSPGLMILPEPAAVGAQWTSVATDPVLATSMTLQGTIKDVRQVDVCGVLVEGYASNVTISVRRPGTAANAKDYTLTATYVIAPQMAGLMLADEVNTTGTDHGTNVTQKVTAALTELGPH